MCIRDSHRRGGRHSYVTWLHPSRCPRSRDPYCMSRDKPQDMLICRLWLTRLPLWWFLNVSTYNVLLMALERYAAVIYPIWYKTKVRTVVYYRHLTVTLMKYTARGITASSMLVKLKSIHIQSRSDTVHYEWIKKYKGNKIRLHNNEQEDSELK